EPFSSSRIGVHLQLQLVFRQSARGCLVIEDRQRSLDPALPVEDDVSATGDGDAIEVKLEGALGLPDPEEIVRVRGGVLIDEPTSCIFQLSVRRLVGGGQEEVRIKDFVDLRRRWHYAGC